MSSPYNSPHYPGNEPQNKNEEGTQENNTPYVHNPYNNVKKEYSQQQWNSTNNDDNQKEHFEREQNDTTTQEKQSDQWVHQNSNVKDKYESTLYDNNSYAYQNVPQHTVSYQEKSNWPQFLIDSSAQQLYGFLALGIGLVTGGLVGLIMSCYYLFLLDDSVEKDSTAKVLNWISFWIPVGAFLLMLIFFFGILIMGTSLAAFVPHRMGLFVT